MALLSKEKLQERLRLSRERHEKKRKAEKERRDAIKQEVLSELKKPKKIKLIKLDDEKYISHRNVGEKTVDGRGYEPYEAVRCNALIPEKLHYSVDTESSLISNILIGDIYETREELMEAENRGEGKINWDYFDEAVKRVRGIIDKIK